MGLAMTGGRKNILAGWKNCNVEDGMMSDCNNYKGAVALTNKNS